MAKYTGEPFDRCHSVGWASTRADSRTCPGSAIAHSVQASSSCSSRWTCLSATVCPTHNTNAASKVHRRSGRRGPGGAVVMRLALQNPTTRLTRPERESDRGELRDREHLPVMRWNAVTDSS